MVVNTLDAFYVLRDVPVSCLHVVIILEKVNRPFLEVIIHVLHKIRCLLHTAYISCKGFQFTTFIVNICCKIAYSGEEFNSQNYSSCLNGVSLRLSSCMGHHTTSLATYHGSIHLEYVWSGDQYGELIYISNISETLKSVLIPNLVQLLSSSYIYYRVIRASCRLLAYTKKRRMDLVSILKLFWPMPALIHNSIAVRLAPKNLS